MEEAGKADKVGDEVKQTSTDAQAQEKAAPPRPAVEIEDAPDPDEDDLDDLDDMLDEFSTVKPGPAAAASGTASAAAPKPSSSGSGSGSGSGPAPAFNPEDLENLSEEDFEKQLEAGMAELMKDLDNSVSFDSKRAFGRPADLTSKQPDMQAQFEEIFKGLGSAAAAGGAESQPSSGPAQTGATPGPSAQGAGADFSQDATFQETIRRTMERMQESGDQATAAAAAGSSEDDFIAEMMKAMKDMPGGGGSDEDFSKMLMGMMEQLTNKEILYEPMKELHEKYPGWLAKNKDTLSKEDLKRYQEQQAYVAEMVAKFESPGFSDSDSADRQYIVERMQKVSSPI